MAMTEAVSLPAAARSRIRSIGRRGAARLVAWAGDEKLSPWLVAGFVILHVVLLTAILMRLRAAQDVDFDVAEGFAWGQNFLLGYGKQPPLPGSIGGLWITLFHVTAWSTYALAMVTVGVGM